ncbi:MAG: FkbM family methyltransferase [Bacteroidota bacterium]
MLKSFKYKNLKIFYREGTTDEDVIDHSFEKDIFFKSIPDFKVVEHMTIIDVGAHIGTFSLYAAVMSKNNKIISLEPNQDTFDLLKRNVDSNGLEKLIFPVRTALSDKDGTTKLYLGEDNWEHSITNDFNGQFEVVPTNSVASIFERFSIENCDLVKFNCEGAEFVSILSMPTSTLKKVKMMLILFHEDMVDGIYKKENLLDFLNKNSFIVRVVKLKGKRGWIIAKNKRYYSSLGNRLFLTKQNFFKQITQLTSRL